MPCHAGKVRVTLHGCMGMKRAALFGGRSYYQNTRRNREATNPVTKREVGLWVCLRSSTTLL